MISNVLSQIIMAETSLSFPAPFYKRTKEEFAWEYSQKGMLRQTR